MLYGRINLQYKYSSRLDHGNETTLNFTKLLQIVKDAGYKGFVGVEYEGSRLSEKNGIIATKKLLETLGAKL